MMLSALLEDVPVTKLFQTVYGQMVTTHDVDIKAIQYDSRKVREGGMFVAIRGTQTDGHQYISAAIASGAKAVVVEDDQAMPDSYFMHTGVVKIVVGHARRALAQLAANFYGRPASKLRIIGVTGTNGKTTTTHLIRHLLERSSVSAPRMVGLIGTIEYVIGGERIPATHTTPESLDLQELFARMLRDGCSDVVMEVSSHALDQDRVYGIPFAAAVFTNLTQDHLDYHHSMDEYFRAKKKLFDMLAPDAVAVTNLDDSWGGRIIADTKGKRKTYGTSADADVRAVEVKLSFNGTAMTVQHDGAAMTVASPLVGRFNVANLLGAIAAGLSLGIPATAVRAAVADLPAVAGRFERIGSPTGWTAIIDYAHTPDALQKCLAAIDDVVPKEKRGRIITVFGAGGDRDRTKRPEMGRIAEAMSDVIFVTSDNPRKEDPRAIINDIVSGMKLLSTVTIEPDRAAAIAKALSMARAGDIVLIAGKGHENYQVIGTTKHPFSDQDEVRKFIGNNLS